MIIDVENGSTSEAAGAELVAVKMLSPTEAIVFGSPAAVDEISRCTRPIPSNFTSAAERIAATAPDLQRAMQSITGRWVELTRESAGLLAKHGGTPSASGGFYGVVRGADGSIAGHLSFIKPDQISKLALTLPSLAGAVAMQLQQASIEKKLDEIKQDLDYVVGHLHDELLTGVASSLWLLHDVYNAVERNEGLDDDHWQMVADLALPVRHLHQLTSSRLASLEVALSDPSAGIGRRVRGLNRALHRDRTLFWLEAHVHAELALLRWQALYLMRQAEQHPETLIKLVSELEEQRAERHGLLQQLARDVAGYLTGGSRTQSILEKVRIISRYRLDRLLMELEDLLRVYRNELGTVGVRQLALPTADVRPELEAAPRSEDERQWMTLLAHLGNVPRVAQRLGQKASAAFPSRIRVRRPDESDSYGPEVPDK
jgi:hypothetical protein